MLIVYLISKIQWKRTFEQILVSCLDRCFFYYAQWSWIIISKFDTFWALWFWYNLLKRYIGEQQFISSFAFLRSNMFFVYSTHILFEVAFSKMFIAQHFDFILARYFNNLVWCPFLRQRFVKAVGMFFHDSGKDQI